MELTTEERVHLVAVGLSEPIPAWRPLDETIARIREAGGLSMLPHPFFRHLRGDKRTIQNDDAVLSRIVPADCEAREGRVRKSA